MKKMRNINIFKDWMNDFEIPQTNEWQKKTILSHTTMIKE
jgi:hypothetical protein